MNRLNSSTHLSLILQQTYKCLLINFLLLCNLRRLHDFVFNRLICISILRFINSFRRFISSYFFNFFSRLNHHLINCTIINNSSRFRFFLSQKRRQNQNANEMKQKKKIVKERVQNEQKNERVRQNVDEIITRTKCFDVLSQ